MSKHILIVDDEVSLAFFLRENLIVLNNQYEVDMAHSGKEALEKLIWQPFDLLITDLRMPDVDGLTLIEEVQARYPHVRTILMTAYGDTLNEAALRSSGVNHYIAKPFQMEDMLDIVHEALTGE
ncbi:MAG TPA: response regulator [Chloroflexi bacterium]|nr:response regulator [Chloroflexota bacterium]